MVRRLVHIMAVCLSAIVFASSCGTDEAEVIPRDDLAAIYAEMMLTDQWIMSTPNVRMIADTSLVYEPILEKYGYDSDDYRKSVDVYMDDPERFAKVLRTSDQILDRRLEDLEKRKDLLERIERIRKAEKRFMPDLKLDEFFPYLHDEPYVHYHDSVTFETDSSSMIYRMVSVECADTLYEGVRMIVASVDTLSVAADTLAAAVDTLKMEKPEELPMEIRNMKEPGRMVTKKQFRTIKNEDI